MNLLKRARSNLIWRAEMFLTLRPRNKSKDSEMNRISVQHNVLPLPVLDGLEATLSVRQTWPGFSAWRRKEGVGFLFHYPRYLADPVISMRGRMGYGSEDAMMSCRSGSTLFLACSNSRKRYRIFMKKFFSSDYFTCSYSCRIPWFENLLVLFHIIGAY